MGKGKEATDPDNIIILPHRVGFVMARYCVITHILWTILGLRPLSFTHMVHPAAYRGMMIIPEAHYFRPVVTKLLYRTLAMRYFLVTTEWPPQYFAKYASFLLTTPTVSDRTYAPYATHY